MDGSNLANDDDSPPSILHSAATGRAFRVCVDCGTELLQTGVPYAVEKVLRNSEVIFEYSLCMSCAHKLMREFSKESLERVMEHLSKGPSELEREQLDLLLRSLAGETRTNAEILAATKPPTFCHQCGRTGGLFGDDHSVMGVLVGPRLLTGITTMCSSCTDNLENVLSRKTRESHEDFVRTHFPGVPAGLDLPAGLLAL